MTRSGAILALLLTSVGSVSAQSILTDQILLLDPALSVSVFEDFGQAVDCRLATSSPSFWCEGTLHDPGAQGSGIDAAGALYQVVRKELPVGTEPYCDIGGGVTRVYDIERRSASGSEIVVRVPECVVLGGGGNDTHTTTVLNMRSDNVNGALFLSVRALRGISGQNEIRGGIVRISGLPTLVDIILSYQPPSSLSLNVPVRPEGLPGADSFALYTGDLATVSDLSQAAPLQCNVPDGRPPVPGEQLTVADCRSLRPVTADTTCQQ